MGDVGVVPKVRQDHHREDLTSRGRQLMERFSFGQPVQPVTWQHPGRKPVLIIGVYPSVMHARWVSADGQTTIRAVANEPEPFWTGRTPRIASPQPAATVPEGTGRLVLAPGHNGLSGQALDGSVLGPAWIDP